MSLLRLAASILLALSLAALTALAAEPRLAATHLPDQALAADSLQAKATASTRAVALSPAAQRRLHRVMLPAPLMPTIPVAGQSVPGAGQ